MLFLVALVLRLGPSIGDLPHIYDYDEPLFMTFEVGRMYSEHSLEPSGYAHPALYKDLSVAALAIVGSVAGWDGQDVIAGPGIFGDHIVNNPMPWFTLRALAAVLGAMAVFLAWDAARRFGVPNWAAAAAAGFGAVAPLLVGVAPRIAPDGFSVFFAILVVWTLAWALQRPSLRRQALLGVTIGLVASAKYNGAPFALLGLVLPVVATRSWQRRVLWLVAAGGAAALAFAITNPYALVHFGDFIDELRTQNSVYSFGLTGDTGRSRQFNARTLQDNAGPLAFMALASVPLVAFAPRATAPDEDVRGVRWELVTTLALVGWTLLQGRYDVRIARNVMPLVLPVCVLGAMALRPAWDLLSRAAVRPLIACAVIVFAGWGGFQVVKGLFEFGASVADERADARTWLNDHVEPGQTVMGEFGTPYVGRSDIAQQEVGLLSELDLDDLRDGKIDWVVSSSETTSGIFSDQARWAGQIEAYGQRFAGVCEWHLFRSWNTEVRVGRACPQNAVGVNSGMTDT